MGFQTKDDRVPDRDGGVPDRGVIPDPVGFQTLDDGVPDKG